jgi:hypothetical protein
LLVVDQFEEVFTSCRDESEQRAYIDNLLEAAAGEHDNPFSLLIILRADFYAQCLNYPTLREALQGNQINVGPMESEELRRAIQEPARRGEWHFEPGLVELILRDAGSEPGALPFLSHALLETWGQRRGRHMTLESYGEAGGVQGAIAKTAETVYRQRLDDEKRVIAKRIFLRLTELGEGVPDTRRRVSLNELLAEPDRAGETQAVLGILAAARLITLDDGSVEVAHEALIRAWPTLQDWLEADREGLRVHRHLTEAALEWQQLGREPGELYRGARLAQAAEWADAHPENLNPLEREFLSASQAAQDRAAQEREAQRQRELQLAQEKAGAERLRAEEQTKSAYRLRTRGRIIFASVIIASMAALIAIIFWFRSSNEARNNEALASTNAAIAVENASIAETAQSASTKAVAERLLAEKNYTVARAR